MNSVEDCELCHRPGGEIVWEDSLCRVVRVGGGEGNDYPGFCRVIWKSHVSEMTDLSPGHRNHLMTLVFATEAALRACYRPKKINLASLGNAVPHLHWHVIPRFADDRNFPAPIWAEARRLDAGVKAAPLRPMVTSAALHLEIMSALGGAQG